MTVPKILIVDDDGDNRIILKSYLRGPAYCVEVAKNAQEARTKLTSGTGIVDVAFLDWMMPGENGLQLLQWMQEHPELRHTQVIMQTALVRPEEVQQGIAAGACYYLTKPFTEETMMATLKTALVDRQTYLSLQYEIRHSRKKPLSSNRLVIRTLEEARDVAVLLAKLCQAPEIRGLGFLEILLNAIEHGNLGITYDEKSNLLAEGLWEQEVRYRLTLPENQAKVVEIFIYGDDDKTMSFLIRDQGNGFVWEDYLEFDPRRIMHDHGRGIAIAKAISFDTLAYRGCGNEVFICVDK